MDGVVFSNVSFLTKEAFAFNKEEELELVEKFKQGDTKAYRKLRRSLRPMINKEVSQVRGSSNDVDASQIQMRIDRELPGLLLKYNPSSGNQLNTFLISNIKGIARNAMYEGQGGTHTPREYRGAVTAFRMAENEARLNYDMNPTDEQIKEFFPDNIEDPQKFEIGKMYNKRSLIGDATFQSDDAEGGEVTFKDMFQVDNQVTDKELELRSELDEIKRIMQMHLSPLEMQVVERGRMKGEKISGVAMGLGISSSEVTQILRKWDEIYKKNKL